MKYNANITSLFGLSSLFGLFSLFGLYCAQGVPLGLAIFALPGILRSLGPICG